MTADARVRLTVVLLGNGVFPSARRGGPSTPCRRVVNTLLRDPRAEVLFTNEDLSSSVRPTPHTPPACAHHSRAHAQADAVVWAPANAQPLTLSHNGSFVPSIVYFMRGSGGEALSTQMTMVPSAVVMCTTRKRRHHARHCRCRAVGRTSPATLWAVRACQTSCPLPRPPPSLYWSLRLQAVRVHCAAVTLTGLGVAFAALQRPEDIVATLEKLVSKTTIEKMCAPGGTHADHRVAWAQRRRANLFRLQGVRIPPTMFVACLPSPSTPMD